MAYTPILSDPVSLDSPLLKYREDLLKVSDCLKKLNPVCGRIYNMINEELRNLRESETVRECHDIRVFIYTLQVASFIAAECTKSEQQFQERAGGIEETIQSVDQRRKDGADVLELSHTIAYSLAQSPMDLKTEKPPCLKEAARELVDGEPPADPELLFFWALHFGDELEVSIHYLASALSHYLHAVYDLLWSNVMKDLIVALTAKYRATKLHSDEPRYKTQMTVRAGDYFRFMYCFGPMQYFLQKALPIIKRTGVPYNWWVGSMDPETLIIYSSRADINFVVRYGSQAKELVRENTSHNQKWRIVNNHQGAGYFMEIEKLKRGTKCTVKRNPKGLIDALYEGWSTYLKTDDHIKWTQVLDENHTEISSKECNRSILNGFIERSGTTRVKMELKRAIGYASITPQEGDEDDEEDEEYEEDNQNIAVHIPQVPPPKEEEHKYKNEDLDKAKVPPPKEEEHKYKNEDLDKAKSPLTWDWDSNPGGTLPGDSYGGLFDSDDIRKDEIVTQLEETHRLQGQIETFVDKNQWLQAKKMQEKLNKNWNEISIKIVGYTKLVLGMHQPTQVVQEMENLKRKAIELTELRAKLSEQNLQTYSSVEDLEEEDINADSIEKNDKWMQELEKALEEIKIKQKKVDGIVNFLFKYFSVVVL